MTEIKTICGLEPNDIEVRIDDEGDVQIGLRLEDEGESSFYINDVDRFCDELKVAVAELHEDSDEPLTRAEVRAMIETALEERDL
jgi:hypothetical protein